MDNYYQECPAMMNDSRGLTDYRSSQVREELFKYRNNLYNENETRTTRINNGEKIMVNEWTTLKDKRACFPKKKCFHLHPITNVTTAYNNMEMMAYNGDIPAPKCEYQVDRDYRMTNFDSYDTCIDAKKMNSQNGYPINRQPIKNKINRVLPERIYVEDIQ